MEVNRIAALIDNYTEEELRHIVENSHCLAEVISKIGYKTRHGSNHHTVKKRLELYNIDTSHFNFKKPVERNYENVFCLDSTASQTTLRRWYSKISNNNKCEICGQEKLWNGKDLTMILDHINGDNHDNRLENLRWICPNCDSQLSTYAGRNSTR